MQAAILFKIASEEETDFQGIPVMIEHPKGSTRTGTNAKGESWSREMHADYGYVPDTVSKGDREDLDVFIGPEKNAPTAYVIDQLKEDGSFDEVKVMLGFPDLESAKSCYLKHYPQGWESRIGDIGQVSVNRLADMVDAEQTANEQRTMEEADRHVQTTKTATLCVTDPVTKKRVALRDAIEMGFEAAPEIHGEGRFLRLDELRELGRQAMRVASPGLPYTGRDRAYVTSLYEEQSAGGAR